MLSSYVVLLLAISVGSTQKCINTYEEMITPFIEEALNVQKLNLEVHCVKSLDGYHLTLLHVYDPNLEAKGIIYLQHGIGANSVQFTSYQNRSFGFYLAKQGFDCWIGDIRGSIFSLSHDRLTDRQRKFWDFSFHEAALNDLPAFFEYIYEKTKGKQKIKYIGHSMGTVLFTAYSSILKDHAQKYIERGILLSPVVYMDHTRGFSGKKFMPINIIALSKLESLGMVSIFGPTSIERIFLEEFCVNRNDTQPICSGLLFGIQGFSEGQSPPNFAQLFIKYWPFSISLKTLKHFVQTIGSGGKAPLYDYGPNVNQRLYNSTIPPEYDIQGINVPIHIITGEEDYLASKQDGQHFYQTLTTKEKTIYNIDNFNHVDFIFSVEIEEKLFRYLLMLLNKN